MAVKGIYAALAVLLGGGLILFGVGSGLQGGGLADIFSDNQNELSDDAFAERR